MSAPPRPLARCTLLRPPPARAVAATRRRHCRMPQLLPPHACALTCRATAFKAKPPMPRYRFSRRCATRCRALRPSARGHDRVSKPSIPSYKPTSCTSLHRPVPFSVISPSKNTSSSSRRCRTLKLNGDRPLRRTSTSTTAQTGAGNPSTLPASPHRRRTSELAEITLFPILYE
jgi:hypothetical protein